MGPEQEPDPEIPQVLPNSKPPMKIETANKWVTMMADYLDVVQEAAKQKAYSEANRKWDRFFSGDH